MLNSIIIKIMYTLISRKICYIFTIIIFNLSSTNNTKSKPIIQYFILFLEHLIYWTNEYVQINNENLTGNKLKNIHNHIKKFGLFQYRLRFKPNMLTTNFQSFFNSTFLCPLHGFLNHKEYSCTFSRNKVTD